jgi:hypothetical protein
MVTVKEDQKPRNTWKLAIIKQLITGKEAVIRAAKLNNDTKFLPIRVRIWERVRIMTRKLSGYT